MRKEIEEKLIELQANAKNEATVMSIVEDLKGLLKNENLYVDTRLGTLHAYPATDPNYPGIYIDLKRKNHQAEASLLLVECTDPEEVFEGAFLPEAMVCRLWEDACCEGYNKTVEFKNLDKYFSEDKYKIVTLCGSTRFKKEFLEVQKKLTLEGYIVMSVGLFEHSGDSEVWEGKPEGTVTRTKAMLDDMHKQRIDMSDEIFVINVGGYIGESTRSEIEYAINQNKTVRFLEPLD